MSQIDKESLRMTHLAQSENFNHKQRHGMFSVPISTAIGDDGQYKTKLHKRNQMGKPETKPRNVQTNPTRSGQLAKSFLGPLNSLATSGTKDEFIEVPKRLMYEQKSQRKLIRHQKQFFPANTYHLLNKSSYRYVEETNPQKQPKRNRAEDGRVKSKARQFQTNPQSRVISDLFKPIKNMSDPYERKHDVQWQRQKAEKAMQGEVVFSPNKYRADLFNSNKSVLEDYEYKRTRFFHETQFKIGKHDNKWKDTNANRKGLYGYFQPFPVYIQNPPRQVKRQNKSNDGKQIFKAMNRTTVMIPSASVTQHPTNLRRSLNHSFSHRPT